MNVSGEDIWFWLAIVGATLFKLWTSETFSFWRAAITVFTAVFAAIFFTEPVLDLMGLNPSVYRTPMAAVIALTGENAMKFVVTASANPQKLVDLWRSLRGIK